jgi:hypothetical protein
VVEVAEGGSFTPEAIGELHFFKLMQEMICTVGGLRHDQGAEASK